MVPTKTLDFLRALREQLRLDPELSEYFCCLPAVFEAPDGCTHKLRPIYQSDVCDGLLQNFEAYCQQCRQPLLSVEYLQHLTTLALSFRAALIAHNTAAAPMPTVMLQAVLQQLLQLTNDTTTRLSELSARTFIQTSLLRWMYLKRLLSQEMSTKNTQRGMLQLFQLCLQKSTDRVLEALESVYLAFLCVPCQNCGVADHRPSQLHFKLTDCLTLPDACCQTCGAYRIPLSPRRLSSLVSALRELVSQFEENASEIQRMHFHQHFLGELRQQLQSVLKHHEDATTFAALNTKPRSTKPN